MKFEFDEKKNLKLISERAICFEEIIQAIANGGILKITNHPNAAKYRNQKILYVNLRDEVYVVPFIEKNEGTIFLKTIFPSRKARRLLLKK